MIRALVVLSALSQAAAAETARVASGEHADFTRLVVQLPEASGWTVGRTAMGYAFATNQSEQPTYDLDTVWDRIPRTRLQGLRADPESGVLQLTLACPCHVLPFEYQPGMVVLDVRDGPAPAGSGFEAAFTEVFQPEESPERAARDRPAEFDWLAVARDGASGPSRAPSLALDTASPSLKPLRDELLKQISRGAADGVVDMQLPGLMPEDAGAVEDVPWAQIRIGDVPGLEVLDPDSPAAPMQPDGAACLPEEELAIADWGRDRVPLDLLAEARSGLYGEFDRIDVEAVRRSVKLHLYLGFGAEALQYAALLPDQDEDLRPLLSMARLVDGETDPSTPFASMLACDSPAALWAALAHDRLSPGIVVNSDAIVRSFSALPPHLRRQLGERLSGQLLELDAEAARMIRDVMQRTPDVPGGTVALLDAQADLQAGQPESAIAHAEAALAGGAEGATGLIALVEAHFQSSQPLGPEVAEGLLALQGQSSTSAELDRAIILALGLSGQVDRAFELAAEGAAAGDLWHVVAERAEDSSFLAHAVLPPDAQPPTVRAETALGVAARLLALGFPDSAIAWIGPTGPDTEPKARLVSAAAELARGDARKALSLLAGLDGDEAEALRVRSQTQLGQLEPARVSLEAAGKTTEARRLAIWGADWAHLSADGSDAWAAAAALANTPRLTEAGLLARGAALLDESAHARRALTALLAEVPLPDP
jgi:hypothetical protein